MIRSRARFRSIVFPIALVLLSGVAFTGPAAAGSGTQFVWPTNGRITQPYGCTGFRWEPRYGCCRHFHGGIDIANCRGTPIRAAAGGVITHVGWDQWGTHNWMVRVSHGNGLVTWYSHMRGKQIADISKGARVRQGQVIGYMSDTGMATGVHLHWAVLKNGRYANPRNYVEGKPTGRAGTARPRAQFPVTTSGSLPRMARRRPWSLKGTTAAAVGRQLRHRLTAQAAPRLGLTLK